MIEQAIEVLCNIAVTTTAQKMKFSFKDFFSKCEQIRGTCGFGHIYWRNP